MRVLPIDPDQLGAVVLRQVPEERPPTADGERVFIGRVIVPGERGPVECRLRTGQEYRGEPGVVTLHGETRATSWYLPGGRGADAKSEITISTAEIRSAPNATPILAGRDLPVRLPFDEALVLAVVATNGPEKRVSLMLPSDLFDGGGGVVEVTVATVDDAVLAGSTGRLIGVTGRISIPDRDDVGRYNKAAVRLSAQRVEPIQQASSNGRARRDSVTVSASGEGPAEGGDTP